MSNAQFVMILALLFRILTGIEDWGQVYEICSQALFSVGVIWQFIIVIDDIESEDGENDE